MDLDVESIGPPTGARFPDVVLPDQAGRTINLHGVRGDRRALLVVFRSAEWCPYCRTQLVDLQSRLASFDRAGVALFGLSYDPVDVLRRFSIEHGIQFSPLSDIGSQTIRRLGLLHGHLAEAAAIYGKRPGPRDQGLPYPGTITLGSDGCVTDKRFQLAYRVRPSAATVLSALRVSTDAPAAVEQTRSSEHLTVTARLDQPYYYPYHRLSLSLNAKVAPAIHVYAAPAPIELVPFNIEVAPIDGLVVGPAAWPAPIPYWMDGLEAPLFVYEGAFSATVPFEIHRAADDVELNFAIRYQACSADLCFPPGKLDFTMEIEGRQSIRA